MRDASAVTFLFTDIEGSTRLWEREPERMRPALARHDEILRAAVRDHGGEVVKMTGDGLHAAFGDPLAALRAMVQVQEAFADPQRTAGLALAVRCGLHLGANERREGDYFGSTVNRAARIMSAAHGGQMLVSHAVAESIVGQLPPGLLLRDLGLVRLRDLAQPERLYQVVHPGLPGEFPALRSLEDTPNNLPLQLSSFVGRQRELAQLRDLLHANRLVTVVGMGGVGKTRLAVHAAAEMLEAHRDGAWLVELAPLQQARAVAQALATALGVVEEAGRPIEEALARHVRERELLIVLDNCEHVLEGAAPLARRLLSVGPGVRVLATSREPLRIPGEAVCPITGLAVPGPLAAISTEAVARFESAQLFVERAASAQPGFALDHDNATAVAAICSRLDGIPLAIELAAARVRSVSIDQIARRLEDRFRLLTAGDPTALPRQRTLRAMIDWSYDLLPERERALFRRLSVFAGGFTLEAAEQVCGDADGDGVLDVLTRLVEKSLVMLEPGERRYALLETVRQYAAERLAECGEAGALGEAHLRYYVRLAEAARPHLAGPGQLEWLPRLDAERENVAVAHAYAGRDPARAADGLRLVDALTLYWAHRGQLELGHRYTEEATARPGAADRTRLRAGALFNLGQFGYYMGRYEEARRVFDESLAIAREVGDTAILPRVLQTLGMVALAQSDLALARTSLEEAVAEAAKGSDKRSLAGASNALAMLHRLESRFERAESLYRQVTALARDSGDRLGESVGLLNLAMMAVELGNLERGSACLAEALGIAVEIGSAHALQSVLEVCAGIAAKKGDYARAARFFGAAEAAAQRTGARRDAADERFLAPRMANARDALGSAAFDAAAREGAALPPERACAEARAWLPATAPRVVA